MNDENLDNVRFVGVTTLPAVPEHLIPKLYEDIAIDEPTLFGNIKNNDFKDKSLSNISHKKLSSKPTDDNHVVTKSYRSSISENNRNRRELSTLFIDQDKEFYEERLTILGSIKVNRNRLLEELSDKKYVYDDLQKSTNLDLIMHYKTISRFPSEISFTILQNVRENKLILEQGILVDIFCLYGKSNVMIQILLGKNKIFESNRYKFTKSDFRSNEHTSQW